MLELKNICKTYQAGNMKVDALKDVSISFRKNEFVSILGPSGCGKTTMLNIVGGLDKYTSGDLIINGKSTKDFNDRDWDTYRNKFIGFVFQSYNLIPHLSILENVELALTLSGIKSKERKQRAKNALMEVGLGEIIHKKPNQLSGGQMQRVAIARAIVNNPEIILADEPTGALDSETSVQVMELLKNIAKKRLVVMVTHNKELAEEYSTRIVSVLDGRIKNDTKPYKQRKVKKVEKDNNKQKNSAMTIWTAFKLSLKNLISKKGKTILVSIAGSIGIIGVALVLAVSTGFTNYINDMQSETLSGYPITISSIAIDYDSVSNALSNPNNDLTGSNENDDELAVYNIGQVLMQFGKFNYLKSDFVTYVKNFVESYENIDKFNAMQLVYKNNLTMLTKQNNSVVKVNTSVSMSSMSGTSSSNVFEGLIDENFVKEFYNIYGTYPQNENEIALVVSSDGTISTTKLDSLGIKYSLNETGYAPIKYEDVLEKEYKVILNDLFYIKGTDAETGKTTFTKNTDIETMYNETDTNLVKTLKITAVLKQKEDVSSALFDEGLMYLPSFTESYRQNCLNSQIGVATQELKNEPIETATLYETFSIDVSELSMFLGNNPSPFSYTSVQEIYNILTNQFKIEITKEEVIDLAMQAIGASAIPSGIYVYPKSFDAKQSFIDHISAWNKVNINNQIVITDVTSFLTGTLGQLIDIISYVLIAFASISLIVSSVMIGIITYTSVIERTKEIGVLRSLGARKKDISRLFNAESATIGIFAGIFGIVVTYALCPLINLIINNVSGAVVGNIALLNPIHAVMLVLISTILTLISGFFPSKIASKKDPVIALRTE